MVKIFRKARLENIDRSKGIKYFYYALGEILLVVIGILIALQINNFAETEKLKAKENLLLKNLRSEFEVNIENLKTVKKNNQKIYNSTKTLKNLIGKSDQYIDIFNTDSLLYITIIIMDFQPNQFVVSQLKNSEKLDIIRSEKIKELLYSWDNALNTKTESFDMLNTYFMNSLIPFLDRHTSISNLDFYGNYEWASLTPLEFDKYKIFSLLQFDNALENHLWCINALDKSIDSLIEIGVEIINEIPQE